MPELTAAEFEALGLYLTSPEIAAAAGADAQRLSRYELKGFDDDVELCRLIGPAG